jgi:PhnB protein
MKKGDPMNRFQPDGWHTVTPRIITSEPEEMVRFVRQVFCGQGEFHVNRPAEIRIGDSLIMISKGAGLREPVSAFLYVYVENVDETYRRAVEAGAESLELPADLPYGDRRAMVRDAWGNLWQIASRRHGD